MLVVYHLRHPGGSLVEQPEYCSETEDSDKLLTILEVSSRLVSDADSSEGWAVRTLTPLVCLQTHLLLRSRRLRIKVSWRYHHRM